MSLMNDVFYIIFLNSIIGSIMYLFWVLLSRYLEKRKKLKIVYMLLTVVIAFFCIPFTNMYLFLMTHDFEQGVSQGILFVRTPVIYGIQCVASVVWFFGAIFNLGNYLIEYYKFHKVLKYNMMETDARVEKIKKSIQNRLKIRGKVNVFCNYIVQVPIVFGFQKKSIVLPVREYSDEEIAVILCHEMTHIRQHVLEMKKLGIILKLVFWFNPLMNNVLNSLDEWGETACDVSVLTHFKDMFSKKDYFNVALAGLENTDIWMPKMLTQLKKERTLKGRIRRMKDYQRDRDMKFAGSLTVFCIVLSVGTISVLAAGNSFTKAYEKVYEETLVEEKAESISGEVIEELFEPDSVTILTAEDTVVMYSGIINIDWKVPANTLVKASQGVYLSEGDTIQINVITNPDGKSLNVGLITPYGTKIYQKGVGGVLMAYEVEKSGTYTVFVENTGTTEFTAIGSATYY